MVSWILYVLAVLGICTIGFSTSVASDLPDPRPSRSPLGRPNYSMMEEQNGLPVVQLAMTSMGGTTQDRTVSLDTQIQVPGGIRLIVFAPHPDDETLAAGGLIQRVRETGGEVRVVFITNGDGYEEGVKRLLRQSQLSANDFIEYGEQRRLEAIQALAALGLHPDEGVFLGFPDSGIDDLLLGHWSGMKPFISAYTRLDHPHYKRSFNRRSRYSASELKTQIDHVLHDFNPDWVVLPDPRDTHPDHYATGVFVLEVLSQLSKKDDLFFADKQFYTYLVHYMDYPSSTAWTQSIKNAGVGGSSFSNGVLSATQWLRLSLTPGELADKQRALSKHETQFLVLGQFLKFFDRPTELFGRLEPLQIQDIHEKCTTQSQRLSS